MATSTRRVLVDGRKDGRLSVWKPFTSVDLPSFRPSVLRTAEHHRELPHLLDEIRDDVAREAVLEIEHVVGDAQRRGHVPGVVDRVERAAGPVGDAALGIPHYV